MHIATAMSATATIATLMVNIMTAQAYAGQSLQSRDVPDITPSGCVLSWQMSSRNLPIPEAAYLTGGDQDQPQGICRYLTE